MRIGIIGYGHLGKALVRGLILTGFSQNDIDINARTQKTRDCVRDEFKDIYVTDNKEELVNRTDVIVLVTEPKNAKEVLDEIKNYKVDTKIVVSFMAGITIAEMRNMLGEKQNAVKLLRVMPNIAIQDGNGVIGVTYEEQDYEIIQDVLNALKKLGYVLRLDEDSLNHITVTAASGLAFAACMMNSYQKASNTLFNDNEKSKEITIRVFENVINMVKREECSFDDIICRITTKGGTTEAGMKYLNQELITENLEICMKKSYEKTNNMMEKLKLVKATDLPASKVMEFRQEFLSAGECSINGSRGLHNYENYEDWLWLVKECEKPGNTLLGVQASTYLAVRTADEAVVGCIEFRHTLNDSLALIGGHIGFSVTSLERRKGYATEMLKLVLGEAKKAGLKKVLLTCDTDNVASCKTIEKCGGRREQKEPFVLDGEQYYKYWITL